MEQPRQWNTFLPWVELWYNTAYHSSTCMTPFQALYGRFLPSIPLYLIGFTPVAEVNHSLAIRDALLKNLKTNLEVAHNRMEQMADRGRRDVTFQEGEIVFLKLQPYCQQSTFRRVHKKLASKYFGPYLIEEYVLEIAYKLKLPNRGIKRTRQDWTRPIWSGFYTKKMNPGMKS